MLNKLLVLVLLLTFCIGKSFSKEIIVQSDRLEINKEEGISRFIGNVYANEPSMKIWSEELVINLDEKLEVITKLIANKNVKLEREEIVAESTKAIYLVEDEKLELYGNVIVTENGNILRGDKFVLDLKDSSSIMSAENSSRVKAVIINKTE